MVMGLWPTLDLVEEEVQHILIEGLPQMVFTRELDILRPRDVLSQVPPSFDGSQGACQTQTCGLTKERRSWRADSNRGPADYEWREGLHARQREPKTADEISAHRFASCPALHLLGVCSRTNLGQRQ